MMYNVLLTKQPNSQYVARVMSLPDVVVSGADDEEVLARVRVAIARVQANSRIVQVEAPPLTETPADPWLRYAGMWEDDPDWDEFQAEIQAFRNVIDRETMPS
jgi:hypothetical protein